MCPVCAANAAMGSRERDDDGRDSFAFGKNFSVQEKRKKSSLKEIREGSNEHGYRNEKAGATDSCLGMT
jgi:hypothetical protein